MKKEKRPFTNGDVKRASYSLIDPDLENNEELLSQTISVLTYWRNCHVVPLSQAEMLVLKYINRIDKDAYIAKRLKRLESIRKKLNYNKHNSNGPMVLTSMQDIAGIRIVLTNNVKLKNFFKVLEKENCFRENGVLIKLKDYIKVPKDDGYRGIHLVAKFKNEFGDNKKVEFQLRTKLQHSWATSLEIVDLFTKQNLKSNDGGEGWKVFFGQVGKQFEIIENLPSFEKNDQKLVVSEYLKYLKLHPQALYQSIAIYKFITTPLEGIVTKVTVEGLFKLYAESLNEINEKIIMHNKSIDDLVLLRLNVLNRQLELDFFNKNQTEKASEQYGFYETKLAKNPNWVVALLSTNAIGGLKQAYPNYFADSEVFLSYITLIKYGAVIVFNQQRKISA
ncbi:hypothetical protein A6M14_02505 [Acinetobacter sp. Ac_877]|uniref:RelA/SpoT domain-containing protein n=1 Tax=Acinetobacter portensis TaxID=1839785 RepID=UPI00128C8BEB|nr:RelA/SpoT domain-containing protein [Acinetobacter portensis]MPW42744.1 hypothetical protein [Acinetobacter portensis]